LKEKQDGPCQFFEDTVVSALSSDPGLITGIENGWKTLSIHCRTVRWTLPFGIVILILGCVDEIPERVSTVPGRWYTAAQLELGEALFISHCASCHGETAAGTPNWREVDSSGDYPPPPLNGTAHGWHHPLVTLEHTIAVGGIPLGGVMPGFSEQLSKDEMRATIAYFQSFWTDDIYERWQEIDSR
jgi:mono/diheme cytochrome c family protein